MQWTNETHESNRIDCTTYLCIGGATTATPLQQLASTNTKTKNIFKEPSDF
jgi:hypothetical protein